MNEDTLKDAIDLLRANGENRKPLHLYAPDKDTADYLAKLYPGVVIHIVPSSYMPTDTDMVLTGEDYEL